MKLFVTSILLCITWFNLSNCFDDHKFASDLYKEINKDDSKSIIYSPMSVQTALSLVMFGSTGETKHEMKTAMHYGNSNDGEIQQKYKTLSASVKSNNGLNIANKIYVSQGQSIKQSFNNIAVECFNSEAQNADFTKIQETAGAINKWVEDQTNNKIKNLIVPGSLDRHTKIVIVNAIYFKGFWKNMFKHYLTAKKQFILKDGNSIEVDMMAVQVN